MSAHRRLLVMRHAKAEPFARTDQERRLTDRGHDEARAAGERLQALRLIPEHVIVSPATRTHETWRDVAAVLGSGLAPVVDQAGYGGSLEVLLDALRALPEQAAVVLLVGHNPVAAYLCHYLDDGRGDPEASAGLMRGLPTAAFAVLELDVAWADLGEGTARVADFHAP